MACDQMLGRGVTNFPCDLEKGHQGPHATPSIMKSVQDRQAWEVDNVRRQAQPGPGLPWSNVDMFRPGTQKPNPRQLVKCQFCPDQVVYEEMLTHVSSHVGRPNPALVPPQSQAVQEPPPGTPQPAPSGVFGSGSATALAEHIAKHPRAPQQAPQVVVVPQVPPGYGYPYVDPSLVPQATQVPFIRPAPSVASGVAEAAAHMAEVMDPAAYRPGAPTHIPIPDQVVQAYTDFGVTGHNQDGNGVQLLEEVRAVLNRYSRENASNTPDFILAEYIMSCLYAFEEATNARDNWFSISQTEQGPPPG